MLKMSKLDWAKKYVCPFFPLIESLFLSSCLCSLKAKAIKCAHCRYSYQITVVNRKKVNQRHTCLRDYVHIPYAAVYLTMNSIDIVMV